jgi:hypothetical protein
MIGARIDHSRAAWWIAALSADLALGKSSGTRTRWETVGMGIRVGRLSDE